MRGRVRGCLFVAFLLAAAGSNAINWVTLDSLKNASLYVKITEGGFSSFFGILFFFAASALTLRIAKVNVGYTLNLVVRPLLIAQFIGRLGCSLSGCCWGVETSVFGLTFRFPVRELEALLALVLFIVFHNRFFMKRLGVYAVAYTAFRFVADFFRGDEKATFFGFEAISAVQITALAALVGSVIFIIVSSAKRKKPAAPYAVPAGKRYQPLPNNYVEPAGKKHVVRVIVIVLVCLIAAASLFAFINPFRIGLFDDLRLSLKQGMSFMFTTRGEEKTVGSTDGVSLIKPAGNRTVANETDALGVVADLDSLQTFSYVHAETVSLADGGAAYVFRQTVDSLPVLGSAKVLVAEASGSVSYVLGDDASMTYAIAPAVITPERTAAGLSSFTPLNGASPVQLSFVGKTPSARTLSTVSQSFPDGRELSREYYMYDTGHGLVRVYQAILSEDGVNPLLGVVADADTDEVITVTPPKNGMPPDAVRNSLTGAGRDVLSLLGKGDSGEIERLAKNKPSSSDPLYIRNNLKRAICLAVTDLGLGIDSAERILTVTNQIAESYPSLNENLYREIFAAQAEKSALNSGSGAEQAKAVAEKVRKAFASCGIRQTQDEAAAVIEAGDKPETFTHGIDFAGECDVFEIKTKAECATKIEITTDSPVAAAFYGPGGKTLVTEYVEKSETLTFYPEDGDVLRVKIKDLAGTPLGGASKGSYSLKISSEEQDGTVPGAILTSVTRMVDAYERSNVTSFLSMVSDADRSPIPAEEAIGYGLLLPGLNSLYGCCGLHDGADLAKTFMAYTLLPSGAVPDEQMMLLKDSHISMEVVNCLQRGDSYAVRARITLEMDGVNLYSGYTLLLFEPTQGQLSSVDERLEPFERMLEFFRGQPYGVTEINSSSLYEIFGSSEGTSDLQSLYDLWSLTPHEGEHSTVYLISLDEDRLANSVFSEE